jgi:hypothetical protein
LTGSVLDRQAAAALEKQLREANLVLAHQKSVPDAVEKLVTRIGSDIMRISPEESEGIDPYLLLALHQGALVARFALDLGSETRKRSMLRVALEKMRQAVRDIVEGVPTAEDQPAKDVARWLVDVLAVPQVDIAAVLGTNPRTFQRWISAADPSEPRDEEALKVRVLARIAQNLRHSFTGPGVLAWLDRPHPELKGAPPKNLLSKRADFEQLVHLAAAARSSAAT